MIQNYDHCLRFQVVDKRISLIDADVAQVVSDNRGCICISVKFDEQWDGVGKTARFIFESSYKDVVLDVNGECICPSEVIKKGRFYLGIYGADLKTTTPIVIEVLESILSMSGEELPDAPTDDVYAQIMKVVADTSISADEAARAAWDAAEAASNAIIALNVAKEELEEGGFIHTIKEKNNNVKVGIWIGTSSEYNALPIKPNNCLVIFTDDESFIDLKQRVTFLEQTVSSMNNTVKGNKDDIRVLKERDGAILFDSYDDPLPVEFDERITFSNWEIALNSKVLAASFKPITDGTVFVPDMLLYETNSTYDVKNPDEYWIKNFEGESVLMVADPNTFEMVTLRITAEFHVEKDGLNSYAFVGAIKPDGTAPDEFDARVVKLIRIC